MHEEAKPDLGKISKVFDKYGMECTLKDETMSIEVTERQSDSIYWTSLSNDTIPEGMKVIFPTPSSIYQFFEQPTDNGQILIPSLEKIVILFKVGKNMRQIPIHLSRKVLTTEEKLIRKIITLEKEILKLKEKHQSQNFEEIKLQIEIQSQQLTINDQKLQIEALQGYISIMQDNRNLRLMPERAELEQKCSLMQRQIEDLLRIQEGYTLRIKVLEQENQKYVKDKENAESLILCLKGEIESHKLVISDLQSELKESRDLLNQLTGEKRKPEVVHKDYGKLLVFEPLQSSVNKSCYNFANNILTKNNSSFNGTGRMIPCAQPIPKTGRYHYGFINRNVGQHPNFRIGVISRSNLASQTYMNGGDVDAVMYYCYSTDKEIIYEGTTKFGGFNIFKGNQMIIVIDREKKQVEWFVENNFVSLTKFTESMKKADNLYFFIQLWSNGDALEMISK